MDIGPVISFTGFPAITSNMQTNIAPRMPTAISIMPFVFIYYLRLSAIQTKKQLQLFISNQILRTCVRKIRYGAGQNCLTQVLILTYPLY